MSLFNGNPNGYISGDLRQANLPMNGGVVSSLPFGGNGVFSLMIIRKPGTDTEPALSSGFYFLPDVQLYHDSEAHPLYLGSDSDAPQWTPRCIRYLPNTTYNQELLSLYDVYFLSGENHPGADSTGPNGRGYIGGDLKIETQGIFSSGEITAADLPFSGGAFALAAVPKFVAYDPTDRPVLPGNAIFLDARLIASSQVTRIFVDIQEHAKPVEISYPTYSPQMFRSIADTEHNQDILENYRLFFMAGEVYRP